MDIILSGGDHGGETFTVPDEFTLVEDRNYGAARLLFLKRHAEPPA